MVTIIQGKEIAEKITREYKLKIEAILMDNKFDQQPQLATILFKTANLDSSLIYVRNQEKFFKQLGILVKVIELPDNIAPDGFLKLLKGLNNTDKIHGIIINKPIPPHIEETDYYNYICPEKDVEGIHPQNLGALFYNSNGIIPCTAAAVIEILDAINIKLKGKKVVIINHSNVLGKPLSLLLLRFQFESATPTVCHIATQDLKGYTKEADILIVGVGKPNFVTTDMVKKGAVVIDVGINVVNGKIVGDVDFDNVKKRVDYITPVPGGVGPVTTAMLIRNFSICLDRLCSNYTQNKLKSKVSLQ